MPTPYTGFASYPVTITVPDGSDPDDAATVAVPLEQLADRTTYLNDIVTGGSSPSFNDATFTGTTTFSGGDMDINGPYHITASSLTFDFNGGQILLASGNIELGPDVLLGGGTGDDVNVRGTLNAQHNSNFAVSKTHTFNGALVSTAGITVTAGSLVTHEINVGGGALAADAALINHNTAARFGPYAVELAGAIVTPTGVGRVRTRLAVTLPTIASNVAIASGDYFLIPSLSADAIYTLLTTGAAAGDMMHFCAAGNPTAFSGIIDVWFHRNQPGQIVSSSWQYNGTAWVMVSMATA